MRLNEIKEAVAEKIAQKYQYPVYIENTKQRTKKPAFFVDLEDAKIRNVMNDERYKVETIFNVYFVLSDDEENVNRVLTEIAHDLFFSLNYIKVGDASLRGSNMDFGINDGIMTFVVNYDFFAVVLNENEEKGKVEKLFYKVGVRNG